MKNATSVMTLLGNNAVKEKYSVLSAMKCTCKVEVVISHYFLTNSTNTHFHVSLFILQIYCHRDSLPILTQPSVDPMKATDVIMPQQLPF